jgi:hypothetical protein
MDSHDIIDCSRLGCYVRAIGSRRRARSRNGFGINRDAGCVSRHRSPSTRRRSAARGESHVSNTRAIEHAAMRQYVITAAWVDGLSISTRMRRSWDDVTLAHMVDLVIG